MRSESLEAQLNRWVAAGLIDGSTAEAILAHERKAQDPSAQRLQWPMILAWTFGALMVGAGLLLFVAAHWDRLSPTGRFASVLAKVLGLHLAGFLLQRRSAGLARVFHGLGTVALGAGIFLTGQIFHLQEHWPAGFLLWAAGAWIGCWLLEGDWVQGALGALLTPIWLAGEWFEATQQGYGMLEGGLRVMSVGLFGLALTYLTSRRGPGDSPYRKALGWIGGLALVPVSISLLFAGDHEMLSYRRALSDPQAALGWSVALGLPLALALWNRRSGAWMNAVGLVWAVVLSFLGDRQWEYHAWCALGAVALVAWGLHEARRERVNLGIAGFALTVGAFFFSSVFDKLGRAFGLMALGTLFLVGGWQLERLRRKLNARIAGGAA